MRYIDPANLQSRTVAEILERDGFHGIQFAAKQADLGTVVGQALCETDASLRERAIEAFLAAAERGGK